MTGGYAKISSFTPLNDVDINQTNGKIESKDTNMSIVCMLNFENIFLIINLL